MTNNLNRAEHIYQALLKEKGLEDTPENRLRFVTNAAKAQGMNREARRRAGIRKKRRGW
jgi:hypothetical protein